MKQDTRQKLIDITFDEIYTHGYQGASLSAILGKAGINKGSMYYFFKSKKEMALAAIEEKLHDMGPQSKAPYLSNLFAWLRSFGEMDLSRGCPFANLIQEMSNIDEEFYEKLNEIFLNFKSKFQAIFDQAVQAGELAPDTDTSKLASMTFMMFEGGILGVKISKDTNEYLLAIDGLEEIVNKYRL